MRELLDDCFPTALTRSLGADLTLLTVDPSLKITFCEGKTPLRLNGQSSHPDIVGSPLLDFFPAEELEDAVHRVLDGESENGFAESEMTVSGHGTVYHRYRVRRTISLWVCAQLRPADLSLPGSSSHSAATHRFPSLIPTTTPSRAALSSAPT